MDVSTSLITISKIDFDIILKFEFGPNSVTRANSKVIIGPTYKHYFSHINDYFRNQKQRTHFSIGLSSIGVSPIPPANKKWS